MNERAFALIFFFWAALTIVTPTLIILSESSKPYLDLNVEESEAMIPRRMMGYIEKQPITEIASAPIFQAPTPAPAPEPEPEPEPKPIAGIKEANLTKFINNRRDRRY